jgi:hypothetical protein
MSPTRGNLMLLFYEATFCRRNCSYSGSIPKLIPGIGETAVESLRARVVSLPGWGVKHVRKSRRLIDRVAGGASQL